MANEAPDPRNFESWEEAFNYPVPVVKKLEVQLRSTANDNRERLRSLVGASYRDLLGTAERIVEMDGKMQQVDFTLGQIGKHCNSRVVERIFDNYVKLDGRWRSQSQEEREFASQLSMLQACPLIISRQLKKGGSLLVAAKVIVLSRLLHKTLSKPVGTPPVVDKLRDQLGALRRRLLARIDRHLATAETGVTSLVETMCAFSLATSSTPTDVLKHFQKVRKEAIKAQLEEISNVHEHILRSLKLCVQTLQHIQSIFPKLLSQALAKLKTAPLIRNGDVQSVVELNLSIHERWVAEEVRNYTPWPRHDELQKADADRIMKSWAREAIAAALEGTSSALTKIQNLSSVVALRQEMIELWLSSSNRTPGLDASRVLDDLRDTLNDYIKELIEQRVTGVQALVTGMRNTIDNWTEAPSKTSLWDLNSASTDISDGAVTFKQSVVDANRGCNESILQLITSYNSWVKSVLEIRQVIKEMKDLRWDDEIEADEDDDIGLDSRQALLSEDDPHLLEEALDEALKSSFERLHTSLGTLVGHLVDSQNESQAKTVFILRILRETRQQLPRLGSKGSFGRNPFTADIIEPLHQKLSQHIGSNSIDTYKTSLARIIRLRKCPARALWEGTPPLPLQPLPSTFKFLGIVSKYMADAGADVWSPGAVRTLKSVLANGVVSLYKDSLEQLAIYNTTTPLSEKGDVNATGKPEETAGEDDGEKEKSSSQDSTSNESSAFVRKDKSAQLLFDLAYLQAALKVPGEKLGVTLSEAQSGLDTAAMDHLQENAREFWKKTYLMFALLS